jgi:hypothetical protein
MHAENLYICDDADKPCHWLLGELQPTGNFKYTAHRISKICKPFPPRNLTSLKEFGFISIYNKGLDQFEYKKTKDSKAQYKDGKPRVWQGQEQFSYTDILQG